MKYTILYILIVVTCLVYFIVEIRSLTSHEDLIVGLRFTSGKMLLVGDSVPDHPTFRVYQIISSASSGERAYKVICLSYDNKKATSIYFPLNEIKDVLVLKGVSP